MAGDIGGSQISALLEAVPGIRNVLRSPVADALVNMIRAAAGMRPFAFAEADELVQYAIRRGLISETEGGQVLDEVRGKARASAETRKPASRKAAAGKADTGKQRAAKRPPTRRPVKKTTSK
jgi:hypothetical protein